MKQDEVRDNTAQILNEVSHDVSVMLNLLERKRICPSHRKHFMHDSMSTQGIAGLGDIQIFYPMTPYC